jgi:hypothetical protein
MYDYHTDPHHHIMFSNRKNTKTRKVRHVLLIMIREHIIIVFLVNIHCSFFIYLKHFSETGFEMLCFK